MTQLFKIIDRFTSFASRSAVRGGDKLLMARKCLARACRKFKKTAAKKKKSTAVAVAMRVRKSFQRGTNKSVAKFYIVIPDY